MDFEPTPRRGLRRGWRLALAALIALGGAAAVTATAGTASALGCTQTITGTYDGALTVGPGQVACLEPGAEVTGAVAVSSGGTLESANATIDGSLTAAGGAAAVTVCGTSIAGAVSVTGSGPVVFGSILQVIPLIPTCRGDTIGGSATFTGNTGGVTLAGNRVGGALACSGNTPAPADDLVRNTAGGTASGQCTAPF